MSAPHPQHVADRLVAQGRMPRPGALAPAGGDYVVFASPSQREGSTHADLAALREVAAFAMRHPETEDVEHGVGYWADGKEESAAVLLRSPDAVVPMAKALRHRFNQKATIGFAEDPAGGDAMHVLRTRETDPDKVHGDLLKHGVEYKTVVPSDRGSTVYVLDAGRAVASGVERYARATGAHHVAVPGRVHFEGGDERPNPGPVKLSLKESMNKARRIGNYFVKKPKAGGSPYAEEQAAAVFKAIGLPHLPVTVRHGVVVAPWTDGLKSLSDDPMALRAHATPDRVAHLVFGEWLVGAGDRIGRNYQTHPDLGLIGNDYGHAFHPLTDKWADHRGGKNPPVESYTALARTPTKWAEYHPHTTSLAGLLPHVGVPRDQFRAMRVPPRAIEAALANEPALVETALRATRDLPAHERDLAAEAMKLRLKYLRDHVTNRGPVTVGDLVTLTEAVRREAERRVVPEPR